MARKKGKGFEVVSRELTREEKIARANDYNDFCGEKAIDPEEYAKEKVYDSVVPLKCLSCGFEDDATIRSSNALSAARRRWSRRASTGRRRAPRQTEKEKEYPGRVFTSLKRNFLIKLKISPFQQEEGYKPTSYLLREVFFSKLHILNDF